MQIVSSGLLEWLVIGGGVHGTHLSHVLVTARGEDPDRVRVLDREPDPLATFWRCAGATGMSHLRSGGVHHLDLDPHSLLRFAVRTKQRHGRCLPPYGRPPMALFRAHCDHVIREHALDTLRLAGSATAIARRPRGFRVETSEGVLEARRVVLALGAGDAVAVPAWAAEHQRSWHVFHAGFAHATAPGARVGIIGGGISAVQLALATSRSGAHPTIIARHALRAHQFDSDPGWLGAKHLDGFRVLSPGARRRQLDGARRRGSVPPELDRAVRRAIHRGTLRWVEAEVREVAPSERGYTLALDRAPGELVVDRLMFATGFEAGRPGGLLVEEAIAALGLPCATCGFPLVRETLEWAPGLYVTGALAELELGPTARNIAGARAAGERLVRAAR